MIDWTQGEPAQILPGMMLHYSCGLVELVGSQKHVVTGPIKAYHQAIQPYWIEWVADLANRKELGL